MERLFLVIELHAEESVAAARDRARERLGRRGDDLVEELAVERASAVEELARRDVRVDDVAALLDQRERGRRVLHDGVEQELALEQMLTLLAQHATELVVRGDQLADFVGALGADREAEIAVAKRDDAARQRADQRRHGLRQSAREDRAKAAPARAPQRPRRTTAISANTSPPPPVQPPRSSVAASAAAAFLRATRDAWGRGVGIRDSEQDYKIVIPAKAGSTRRRTRLDPGLRRDDDVCSRREIANPEFPNPESPSFAKPPKFRACPCADTAPAAKVRARPPPG